MNEKYEIACYREDNLLNESGLVGTCKHKMKCKLTHSNPKD